MGSFDLMCAVSNLPIQGGDPVRYFLLTHRAGDRNGRSCGADDVWFPRTPPMRVTYDDYGRCRETPRELMAKAWEAQFREDLATGNDRANLWTVLDLIHEGNVRVRQDHADSLGEMRRTTDAMLAKQGKLPSVGKSLDVSETMVVAEAFVREDVWHSMIHEGFAAERAEYLASDAPILKYTSPLDGPPFCSSPADTFRLAKAMRDRGGATPDEWDVFVRACAELLAVKSTMETLRLAWHPSSYGGQMHAWSEHSRILGTWAQIARDESTAEAMRNAEDDE